MQLFLDTTDTAVLKDLAATGLVDGVTTNPSLIAKSGRNMLEVIAEICGSSTARSRAEVAAMDVAGMLAEGRKLAGVAANVVVKVPLTREGLMATGEFAARGHPDQRHPLLLRRPGAARRQGRRDLHQPVHRPPGRPRRRRAWT